MCELVSDWIESRRAESEFVERIFILGLDLSVANRVKNKAHTILLTFTASKYTAHFCYMLLMSDHSVSKHEKKTYKKNAFSFHFPS